jgi:hypothetical protein
MNCKECGAEFTTSQNRGHEQQYCSHVCRQKAGNKRHKERLLNQVIHESGQQNTLPSRDAGNMDKVQRERVPISTGVGVISDNYLAILEKLYEAKNEAFQFKLKCEILEKELMQKNQELAEMEEELSEDGESENRGILGNIEGLLPTLVKSYKEEPEATMGFIKHSFSEIASNFIGHGKS